AGPRAQPDVHGAHARRRQAPPRADRRRGTTLDRHPLHAARRRPRAGGRHPRLGGPRRIPWGRVLAMAPATDPLGLPSWLRLEHPAAVRDRLRAETAAEQARDAAWHVTWPADALPKDVQQWLRQQPAAPTEIARIVAWLDDVGSLPTNEAKALCAAAARAYRAHRAVEQDRHTQALAVPTTREAHDLVAGLNYTIGHRRKNRRRLEARRVPPAPREPLRFEVLRREKPDGTEQRLATLTVSPAAGADRLQGEVI